MIISSDSWHFKIYKLARTLTARFGGNLFWETVATGRKTTINLCPYMRTILIWGPLVFLIYAAMIAFGFYVLVYFPWSVTGGQAFLYSGSVLFFGVLFIVAFALMLAGTTKLSDTIDKRRRAKKEEMERLGIKPSGFRVILWEYIKSLKSKTCVMLEVK